MKQHISVSSFQVLIWASAHNLELIISVNSKGSGKFARADFLEPLLIACILYGCWCRLRPKSRSPGFGGGGEHRHTFRRIRQHCRNTIQGLGEIKTLFLRINAAQTSPCDGLKKKTDIFAKKSVWVFIRDICAY